MPSLALYSFGARSSNTGSRFKNWKLSLYSFVGMIIYLFCGVAYIEMTGANGLSVNDPTFIDIVYYLVVQLSTVGYGDIYPTEPSGKIFIMMYMFGGVLIFSLFFASIEILSLDDRYQYSKSIKELCNNFHKQGEMQSQLSSAHNNSNYVADDDDDGDDDDEDDDDADDDKQQNIEVGLGNAIMKSVTRTLFASIISFISLFFISVLIYKAIEGFSWLNCFYYVTGTITSIGYSPTPTTQIGRVFAIFFICIGSYSFFALLAAIVNFLVQREKQVLLTKAVRNDFKKNHYNHSNYNSNHDDDYNRRPLLLNSISKPTVTAPNDTHDSLSNSSSAIEINNNNNDNNNSKNSGSNKNEKKGTKYGISKSDFILLYLLRSGSLTIDEASQALNAHKQCVSSKKQSEAQNQSNQSNSSLTIEDFQTTLIRSSNHK